MTWNKTCTRATIFSYPNGEDSMYLSLSLVGVTHVVTQAFLATKNFFTFLDH